MPESQVPGSDDETTESVDAESTDADRDEALPDTAEAEGSTTATAKSEASDTKVRDRAEAAKASASTSGAKSKDAKSKDAKTKDAKATGKKVSAAARKGGRTSPGAKPKKTPRAPGSRRWVPPTFIIVGLLGVAWLITYYVAGPQIPYMSDLGNWNILIGMGGMAASFVIATFWK